MTIYNWIMTFFAAIMSLTVLYLLLSGKAARRNMSKTEKVCYHLILLVIMLQLLSRHLGVENNNLLDFFK